MARHHGLRVEGSPVYVTAALKVRSNVPIVPIEGLTIIRGMMLRYHRDDVAAPRRGTHARRTVPAILAVVVVCLALSLVSACRGISQASAAPPTTTGVVLQGDAKVQADSLQAQAKAVQSQMDELDGQLEQLTEGYNEVALRVEQTNQDLAAMRRRLQDTKATYLDRQAQVENRLVATYKSGNNSFLEILLATDDFTSFIKRFILLYRIDLQDQRLVQNTAYTLGDLSALERDIIAKKGDELALRQDLQRKSDEIEGMLSRRKSTLDGLDSRIAQLVEQERQRQEAERQLLEAELRSKLAGWQRYDGPVPQTDDAILNQFVQTAAAYLGLPYVWAGEKPSTGMDCSGFTRYVFAQHGVVLPHYSGYQAEMGVEIAPADIKPGDLLAFGNPAHHVGIYIGEDRFIHAPRTGDVIRISTLSDRSDLNTIRRFPIQPRQGPPAVD